MNTRMRTLNYPYLRALELEGRHPLDAGAWPATYLRIEIGEGYPVPDSPSAVYTFPDGAAYPPTRRPPRGQRMGNFYYRSLRSAAECDRYMALASHQYTRIAFYLTADWGDPPGGLIPLPSAADRVLPQTHGAQFIGRVPERRLFQFQIKWLDWGDRGRGYMPYEYFDRYVFDCWATYGLPDYLRLFKLKRLDTTGHVRWSAHDEEDHRIYAFEVRDPRSDERYAWTFVVERDGALEVEELYVRPEWRRSGHGRWLADRVVQLAREKGMPLRLWVGYVDCRAENGSNYPALVATARRLGVHFQPCPAPWAAYFGTTEQPGEMIPVEPTTVPLRPRTPRKELLAAVMALSIGTAEPALPSVSAVASQAETKMITVGTPEWERLTERRAQLIHKKNRDGLNAVEREEYEQLQSQSQAAIVRAFPGSGVSLEELAALERELEATEAAPQQ